MTRIEQLESLAKSGMLRACDARELRRLKTDKPGGISLIRQKGEKVVLDLRRLNHEQLQDLIAFGQIVVTMTGSGVAIDAPLCVPVHTAEHVR